MLPTSVKVGGDVYRVEVVHHPLTVDRREVLGKIDFQDHVIRLRGDIGDDQDREASLWHEIIHAIVEDRRIPLGDDDEHEKVVKLLERGLWAFIKDNGLTWPHEMEA